MIDIYQAWIRDFGIDGFRIDTMKHVNDEFWQRFAPEVLTYARQQGKREFFMFGEVFDTTKSFTSHFTTHDRVQAVLDFPFQKAAQDFAANSPRRPTSCATSSSATTGTPTPTPTPTSCPPSSATTTWGGSGASSRWPTATPTTPSSWPATGWRTS